MQFVGDQNNICLILGEYSEQVTLGTVRGLTPSTHATPQSSGQHDDSQPEAMDYTATALVDVPENVEVGPKEPEDAALDAFLPPLPKSKCSDELQVGASYQFVFSITSCAFY